MCLTMVVNRQFAGITVTERCESVAYLGGGLVRGPPLWPDRRDFCNYFGIIFSAV